MFKDIFKDLRIERGLTQKQVAKDLNFSVTSVSSWESGHREPTLETLINISLYFNVSTDYLLDVKRNGDKSFQPDYQKTCAVSKKAQALLSDLKDLTDEEISYIRGMIFLYKKEKKRRGE